MPRKRPARLRAEQMSARPGLKAAEIPGLSRAGQFALARLELTRLGTGATAFALRWWSSFLRHPYHRLHDSRYEGCGFMECCPDPGYIRMVLNIAATVLPRRDARKFRRRLAGLDELW